MDLSNSDIADLIALRRDLHRAPEVSRREAATAARMAAVLAEAGADAVATGLGGHGVAGVWSAAAPGPTVMFRAELDALPIREAEGPDWRSQAEGVAHLCGHDGHMTILAGLARMLGRRPPARGRVILLLQSAEEDGSGAAAVLADPRFDALRPDWAFAIHNMPGIALGRAWLAAGPANCASAGLAIRLTGATAHASTPETGRSPAPALAALMQRLPALSVPQLGPDGAPGLGFRLATITHAALGEPAFGIAPADAVLFATLRAVADDDLEAMIAAAEAEAGAAAAADGLALSIERHDHFAASVNDAEAVALLQDGLAAAGIETVAGGQPFRGSEDFGRFGAAGAKAAMAFVGSGAGPALHSEGYDFNDSLIAPVVRGFDAVRRGLVGP